MSCFLLARENKYHEKSRQNVVLPAFSRALRRSVNEINVVFTIPVVSEHKARRPPKRIGDK
jgi:hypothetical protein